MEKLFAGIETGGTKCVCAVGTSNTDLRHTTRIETRSPQQTLADIVAFFTSLQNKYEICSLGIASFGPLDLHKNSPTYGYLTTTPKLEWQNTDLVGTLQSALHIPVSIDLDVNGAALAEGKWGSAIGLDTYIYITVGTGIGVGIITAGNPLHGLLHPEGGHIYIPLHPKDPSQGYCPFHGNCLEGLASAPAIAKRWNAEPADLPDDHLAWELEAWYLATAISNYIFCLSPQRIIIGGGVMGRNQLIERVQKNTLTLLAAYIQNDSILQNIEQYIVLPQLEYCGVLGAILLAQRTMLTQ